MRRTTVVRAAPAFDASARREHQLCLRGERLPAAGCMHLHPTDRCYTLDSLLDNAARFTASTATIGGAVAVAFIAAADSFSRGSDALA